jgi:hypothetical protein
LNGLVSPKIFFPSLGLSRGTDRCGDPNHHHPRNVQNQEK